MATDPQTVTVHGRLSYPTFTAQEAYALSLKGHYAAESVAKARPSFNVLLNQAQVDKLTKHVETEFIPFIVAREVAGEKNNAMNKADAARLLKDFKKFESATLNTPLKVIPEKTAVLVPDAVANLKVIGSAGTDIEVKAVAYDENELAVPDPDLLTFPVILPINKTVHSVYGGALVSVTLNLYSYYNGKHPGFSAGASVAVIKPGGDRFGGGVAVDEDEIFMDA